MCPSGKGESQINKGEDSQTRAGKNLGFSENIYRFLGF
jgi:hypothetical protein